MSSQSTLRAIPAGTHPPYLYPDYKSTPARAPLQPLVPLQQGTAELGVAQFPGSILKPNDMDLTRQSSAEPLGQRIVVSGRVIDEDGKPVRNSLLEVWQCNAAGRYFHSRDQHDAPLDPALPWLRQDVDRRSGQLPVRHDQAGRLSLGQPSQRVAAGAHSLLDVRQRLCAAPGHADVLPGRSAVPLRSDLQQRPGAGPRAGWCRSSIWVSPSRASRWGSGSISCCAGAALRPSGSRAHLPRKPEPQRRRGAEERREWI